MGMDERRRSRGREGVSYMPVFSYVQYITEFEFNVSLLRRQDSIRPIEEEEEGARSVEENREKGEQYIIRNFCCFPHHPSHMLSAVVCVARYKKKNRRENDKEPRTATTTTSQSAEPILFLLE